MGLRRELVAGEVGGVEIELWRDEVGEGERGSARSPTRESKRFFCVSRRAELFIAVERRILSSFCASDEERMVEGMSRRVVRATARDRGQLGDGERKRRTLTFDGVNQRSDELGVVGRVLVRGEVNEDRSELEEGPLGSFEDVRRLIDVGSASCRLNCDQISSPPST